MSELDAVALSRRLSTRTPSGIAEQIRDLIDAGDLPPGTRLPTVRDIAQEVGVSVGTIAQAWGILREENVVETRRRGGTRVVDAAAAGAAGFEGFHTIDLRFGSPDPALLPPLEEAFASALKHPSVNSWGREHMVEELRRAVAPLVPFTPEAWMSAGGGGEALWLTLQAATAEQHAMLAVETPASPGVLDTIRQLGVATVAVETDDDGPIPSSLAEALGAGATAFIHSPAGGFSDRHLLTAERAQQLAEVLSGTETLLIEDEPLGPLAAEASSLGELVPERTVRVLTFCRAVGVDLRTAVLAGPRRLLERAAALRAGGLGSNSRILQLALATVLNEPRAQRVMRQAQRQYAARRSLALGAFSDAGLKATSGPGSWSVWVEVPDESAAALALSGQGVIVDVAASSYLQPSQSRQDSTGRLRLTVAQLPEDPAQLSELAALIAQAGQGTLRASLV